MKPGLYVDKWDDLVIVNIDGTYDIYFCDMWIRQIPYRKVTVDNYQLEFIGELND